MAGSAGGATDFTVQHGTSSAGGANREAAPSSTGTTDRAVTIGKDGREAEVPSTQQWYHKLLREIAKCGGREW